MDCKEIKRTKSYNKEETFYINRGQLKIVKLVLPLGPLLTRLEM